MGLLPDTFLIQALTTLSLFLAALVLYFKYQYYHWTRKGVPSVTPSIPWGNFRNLFFGTQCLNDVAYDVYRKLKAKGHKHGGLYFLNTPVYMPIDPEYVKNILTTDFEYFNERGVYYNEKLDPLSTHLFNLPNKQWKVMRAKMSPTFTTGKLKMMFPTMEKCSEGLIKAVEQQEILDINDVSIRYTVDIIGSCAFGIDCNSLKNPDTEFKKIAKYVTNPPYWYAMKFFCALMSPKLARMGNLNIYQSSTINFFMNLVRDTVEYREKNNVKRNDFMQLMINMKADDEKLKNCQLQMDTEGE